MQRISPTGFVTPLECFKEALQLDWIVLFAMTGWKTEILRRGNTPCRA